VLSCASYLSVYECMLKYCLVLLFFFKIGQKPFRCPQCPVTFSTKSNRERHMIRKHGLDMHDPATRQMMDRPFKCHLCIFSSFSSSGTTAFCGWCYNHCVILYRVSLKCSDLKQSYGNNELRDFKAVHCRSFAYF